MISIEQILGLALQDRTVLDRLADALSSDLVVANPIYRRIAEFAGGFALEYRKLPGAGDWELWLGAQEAGEAEETREALQRLLAQSTAGFEPDFFGEQILEELRKVAATNARSRLNTLQEVDPDSFRVMAEKVEAVRGSDLQGLARLHDLDIWLSGTDQVDTFPTGFPGLDKAIGGWGKELVIIFADSGVGKSMFLQNAGAHAARRGKGVLHISLELALRPMIHRYYRQIAQVDRGEFRSETEQVRGALEHWFRFAQGSVHLIELPPYETSSDQIHRVIDRVDRLVGGLDMVIVDYLDLVGLPKDARSRSGYEDLNRITHLVRSYCSAFGVATLTASQAVRRPENSTRLTVRDMGDSYGKVRGADVLLSLVQTPEEEEVHQGRIGVLKVREYGGKGAEIPTYINRDLALIAPLDHPNTVQLMKRIGHLDGRPVAEPFLLSQQREAQEEGGAAAS